MTSAANIPACPFCSSIKSVAVRRGRFETTYNKTPVAIDDVEMCICESCGEEFFTRAQERVASQRVLEVARRELGVLSPERIVAIRRRLGLSQEEMETLLGLGDKVVTRWENGRVVPGKTTDILLRLIERKPDLIDELRSIRREMVAS